MKSRTLISTLALVLAMLACNLPANTPVTETPTEENTAIPTQPSVTEAPTQTLLPTNTPPPTLTSTPSVPTVFAKDVGVNCRFGPGIAWVPVSSVGVGQSSQIVGMNSDRSWWYIVDPFNSGQKCWVSVSVTNAGGNLSLVPVVESPKATVTKVTVDVDPKTISVPGCSGPIPPSQIKGTIETNGPTTVKWHFETQQDGSMTEQTTEFDTFGSKDFSVAYTPTLTAGTYWVRLIVTSPNDIQGEAKYTIACS